MWTLIGLIIVGLVIYGFIRSRSKPKDKYYLIQEQQTRVRNRIVKVPGKKRR